VRKRAGGGFAAPGPPASEKNLKEKSLLTRQKGLTGEKCKDEQALTERRPTLQRGPRGAARRRSRRNKKKNSLGKERKVRSQREERAYGIDLSAKSITSKRARG